MSQFMVNFPQRQNYTKVCHAHSQTWWWSNYAKGMDIIKNVNVKLNNRNLMIKNPFQN